MIRVLSIVSVGVVILLVMLTVTATAIGRSISTNVATIAANPQRNVLSDEMVFRLVDLNRFVSVPISPPIESVRDVVMTSDGQSALLLTRSVSTERSDYGLHYFHLISGAFQTIVSYETPERDYTVFQVSNIYRGFSPSFSPDGSRVAIVDSVEQRVIVFNLETGTRTLLQELRYPTQYLWLNWTPDGTQLAYREPDNSVVVVHADGSNMQRFENVGSGTPTWSPDGRWLVMVRSANGGATHIQIMEPTTGEPHPYADALEGSSPAWSCDGQWLSYISSSRQVHLLNLETGETVNPHELPVMADVRLLDAGWLQDCQRMILRALDSEAFSQPFDAVPLYLLDTQTMEANLLTEKGFLIGVFEDDILYSTTDSLNRRTYLFRLNLETWNTQPIGDVPQLNVFMRPLDRSRGLYMDSDTRQIILLDFERGSRRNLLPEGESGFNLMTWQTG